MLSGDIVLGLFFLFKISDLAVGLSVPRPLRHPFFTLASRRSPRMAFPKLTAKKRLIATIAISTSFFIAELIGMFPGEGGLLHHVSRALED